MKGALHESRAMLDRLDGPSGKRSLPMLDAIRIASPCSASWDAMEGDEKSRFCTKCEKNVYNLSAMTREEAELTMRAKEGDLCVRLYQRTDGTVLTQDCPVGVRRKRLRIVGALALGSSLAGTAAAFGLALQGDDGASSPCTLDVSVSSTPITPPASDVPPVAPANSGNWKMGARRAPLPPEPKTAPTLRPLMGKPSAR